MTLLASPPDDAILRAFLLGTLPPDVSANVSTWVESDRTAAERLRGIDAHDTVVDAIGNAAETETSPYVSSQAPPVVSEMEAVPLPTEVGGYRILGELGRGGMGIVLEAEDIRLKRRVAIKLIAAMLAGNPASRERFLREARAVATIAHENVVPILHVGEDAGQLYLVMPLLKGETLNARLRREKQLPVGELVRIGLEVAAGLAAAHAAGLVHRDVKPGNIWLEAGSGRVKLLDFGLAKPLDSATDANLTDIGAVMGTPHYMAPEQAEGKPVDSRADLFSLGAVLYHAAAGRRPFQGETKLAILIAVLHDTPLQLEKLNANLSPQLVALIRSLLEKDPAKRYASAEAVVDALRRISLAYSPPTDEALETASFQSSMLEGSGTKQVSTPNRRWVWQIAAIGVAVAIVGVGLSVSGLPWIKKPVETADVGKPLPPVTQPKPIVTIGTHDRRHRGEVVHMNASPTLGLAALMGQFDGVKLWDTRTLQVKASCPSTVFGESQPRRVVILNGEWLAASHHRKLYVMKVNGDRIDVHSARELGEIHQIAASPDGRWLAVNRGKHVDFWSLDQLIAKSESPTSTVPDLPPALRQPDQPEYFSRFGDDSQSFGLILNEGVQFLRLDQGHWKKDKLLRTSEKEIVASFAVDPKSGAVYLSAAELQPNKIHFFAATTKIEKWEFRNDTATKTDSLKFADPNRTYPGQIELLGDTGIMLGFGFNRAITFSRQGPMKVLADHSSPFSVTRPTAPSCLISANELLAVDGCLLRKFGFTSKTLTEIDPVPFDKNVYQVERSSLFGAFGDRVMIVGRESGSPVRVWELSDNGPKQLFERKSNEGVILCQRAALSPGGNEVMIADHEATPVVWGFDGKGRQVATTTFSEAARRHEPLALTADGKYALMMQLDDSSLTVWDRTKLATPVSKFKVAPPAGDEYTDIRVYPVKDGWRVLFLGYSKGPAIADAVDIRLADRAATFTKGNRISCNVAAAVVRDTLTLAGRGNDFQPNTHHWVLEDRGQTPSVDTTIPLPADFRGGPGRIGVALAPGGNILAAYYYGGRTILFDRTTMKTVWDYQFPGGIMSLDFLGDDSHLMVIHADGVVEVIDTKGKNKSEEKK